MSAMSHASRAAHASVDLDHVESLLAGLQKQVAAFRKGNAHARLVAATAAHHLATALESPGEWLVRSTWVEPSHLAVARVATDVKLWEALCADDGIGKSTLQLAQACKVEQGLMEKITRVLASMGSIREDDVDKFAPNAISRAMATATFGSALKFMHPFITGTNNRAPLWLAEHGYKVPIDPFGTIVQSATNSNGKHAIQIYADNGYPDGLTAMMEAWNSDRPHWSDKDFFPVQERLIDGAKDDKDAAFMVDVGGGAGHDLVKFSERYDEFPGHLILQDIPSVIDPIVDQVPAGIRATVHDFLEPQPVKDARVYFLHSIIHDNPDGRALVILKQLAAAMKKGYSKLIVWDVVLPAKDVPAVIASMDWEMMTFFAASERTESQWIALLEHPDVGLKVNGFWDYSQYDQSIIEAELA